MNLDQFIGEFMEFKRQALEDLADLKTEIRGLLAFKWKIIGASIAVSAITTFIVETMVKK